MTIDDIPVYGPALKGTNLVRQQCTVRPVLKRLAQTRSRTAGLILTALWKAVMEGRVRLSSPVRKLLQHLLER